MRKRNPLERRSTTGGAVDLRNRDSLHVLLIVLCIAFGSAAVFLFLQSQQTSPLRPQGKAETEHRHSLRDELEILGYSFLSRDRDGRVFFKEEGKQWWKAMIVSDDGGTLRVEAMFAAETKNPEIESSLAGDLVAIAGGFKLEDAGQEPILDFDLETGIVKSGFDFDDDLRSLGYRRVQDSETAGGMFRLSVKNYREALNVRGLE